MPSLTLQKLQDLRALTTVSTPATVFVLRQKRHAKPELRCSLESADEDTRYVVPEADLCSRACSLVAPACSSRLAGDRDPSVLGLNLLDNHREPVFHFSKGNCSLAPRRTSGTYTPSINTVSPRLTTLSRARGASPPGPPSETPVTASNVAP